MAGLFAAEIVSSLQHLLQHIAIAHRRPRQRNPFLSQDSLKAKIRHGRCDHAILLQLFMRLQVTADNQQHPVAIYDVPVATDEQGAIRVPVKSRAKFRTLGNHPFLQSLQVQRAASGIDVSPVRLHSHR